MKLKRILFCFLFLFFWVVSVRAQTVRVDGSGNLVGAYSNFFSVNAQLWIKELVSRRYLTNGMALTNLSSLGGTNGQIPYANAAGGISWSNAPSGGGGGGNTVDGITNNQVGVALSGTFTGTGTGLSLDAGQLGTGTVPDARLAGSVVRSNNAGALSFTNANNQFTGQFTASGTNRAGLILNAMTTAQRTALGDNAALDGALIYNTQKGALEYYMWGGGYGARWSKLTPIDVFSQPLNLYQDLDGHQNILYMDQASSLSSGYLGATDFVKFNAALSTNDSRVLNLTNQLSRFTGSNYYVGPGLILQTTTNAIAVFGSGNAVYDGVYARLSSTLYSNNVNGAILTFQNPTWYLQSASAVNQYSSSSLFSSGWTVVSGTAPGPGSGYAAAFNLNGVQFTGSWNSTNLNSLLQALTNSLGSAAFQARTAFQPASATLTNLAATGAITNGLAAGTGITFSTNSGVLTITSVSGAGTVTSVAITVPSDETVIGSPITSSGTIAISRNAQGANQFLAGPSSGGSAVPGYRAITLSDLPYTPAPSNYNGVVGALGFTPATNVVVTAPYRTNIVAWSDGFANLNNWRKIAPDSSFSIVGGKVRLGNYMDYLHGYGNYLVATNWVSALKNVCVTFDVTPVTQSAIGFGWYFEDDRASADDTVLLFAIGTGIGVGEKANAEVYYGRTNLLDKIADASMKLFPFSVGDSLHVRLTRRETVHEVYVTNSTTGAELLYTYQTALNPAQHSDGISYDLKNESFCLWSISGTNDVDNVVFNLQPIWPVNTLLLGDSITSGLMAESAEQSYASLLKRSLGPTVCNMGEPGATVGSITRTLPEINMLSPSNVVLMVGGNDIGSGDAIAAVKSGYASLVSQITNRGTIFHCLPTPWVNLGAMTNMVEFVCTNYPSSTWIDLYHPFLKNNTTDPLPSFYYTGDGIHPNAAGSAIIYRQIYNKLTGE